MGKIELGQRNLLFPYLPVLVGTKVKGRPNYITIALIGWLCYDAISISVGHNQYSNAGIRENGTFSINQPTADMVKRERKATGREEISEKDRRRQVKPEESTPGSASSPAQADKETQEAARGKVGETTRPLLNLNGPHRQQVFSESVSGGREAPVKQRVQVTVTNFLFWISKTCPKWSV